LDTLSYVEYESTAIGGAETVLITVLLKLVSFVFKIHNFFPIYRTCSPDSLVECVATDYIVGIRFPTEALEKGALPVGVRRSGLEADYSQPSSAEVKNGWNYNTTPLTSS
jgi:hypothetical protein